MCTVKYYLFSNKVAFSVIQEMQHKHLPTRENKNEGTVAFMNLVTLLAVKLMSVFF